MLSERLTAYAALTNEKLDELLGACGADDAAPLLGRSMAYSVFSGGKRLRPALCMAACDFAGGRAEDALLPACALELIHTYSLIHDDLPAMDDDDYRRGRPSSHVAFGEANAILAGDGLQALAFAVLSDCPARDAAGYIARGAFEMVMGQSLDCSAAPGEVPLETLQRYKTGALFRAAAASGAACANAPKSLVDSLVRFADAYGMLFQITDDILDCEGEAAALGKSVGKDAKAGKGTFATVYGVQRAGAFAKEYAGKAREALRDAGGGDASFFTELVGYTLERRS